MNDITNFQTMTWEELISFREKLLTQAEEIESALDVLKGEILIKLEADGTPDGKIVGEKAISVRTSYTTDKETAKDLGAMKTFSTTRIDTAMIKALHLKGVPIPNLQINKTPIVGDVVRKQKEE